MSPTDSSSTGQALFAAEPPRLTPQDAAELAARHYGLQARADVLTSERDQNFRLTLDDGRRFVLKVTHPAEDPAVTDFHTQAQLWLMRAGSAVPIPQLLAGRHGDYVHWHDDVAGMRRAIRLITYVPGRPLHSVPRSAAQRRHLGRALARFDRALAGFSHPMADHELLWDLQHADRLADLLPEVDDAGRRRLAERHLQHFADTVRTRLAGLRRQVIHNDLNAYNVMVDDVDPAQISALLDFGDMVRAPLVQDIAVACAYQLDDAADPLSNAARDCLASYHRELPLTEAELLILPDLIMARLLITVLITGWRARQHPENRQYILRNNGLAWNGLMRLDALSRTQAQAIVLDACQTLTENAP